MKKINFRFLAIAFITLPCLLVLPLSAGDNDSGPGTWTDVWGQASIYNIWYDATKPETINSSGTIYVTNNSEDTSYEYDNEDAEMFGNLLLAVACSELRYRENRVHINPQRWKQYLCYGR